MEILDACKTVLLEDNPKKSHKRMTLIILKRQATLRNVMLQKSDETYLKNLICS